jgi:hypothetical protein
MRSQIAFVRGAVGGLVRIWMSVAVKTASNAVVNRESCFRSRNFTLVAGSAGSLSRVRAAGVVHAPVGCALTPSRCARREPCSTAISA